MKKFIEFLILMNNEEMKQFNEQQRNKEFIEFLFLSTAEYLLYNALCSDNRLFKNTLREIKSYDLILL